MDKSIDGVSCRIFCKFSGIDPVDVPFEGT